MFLPLTRRRLRLLPPLLLICTGISYGAPTDTPGFTYHADASEVRLSFTALDQNNHAVATLQAGDFAIVDNDVVVRNFQTFARSGQTKLEIAILIDTSDSVAPQVHQAMIGALKLLSQAAGVPDENVSVVSFQGQQPAMVCATNCGAAKFAADVLPAERAGALTPLFDTVVFSSRFLSQHGDPHATKVLILFSDGEDTISQHSLADAIDVAQTADVQIYGIDLGPHPSAGAAVLNRLASSTGGRYFPSRDGGTSAMNAILEELRATYTVSYQLPSHASGFHAVRILPTHNRNLEFRSRGGYYYPNREK